MNDCCVLETVPGSFFGLLAFGAVTSAGHCLGMCGPLVSAFAVAQGEGVSGSGSQAEGRAAPAAAGGLGSALAVYQAGRLTSYALLGALFASVGSLLPARFEPVIAQAALSLVAGLALLFVALSATRWWPSKLWSSTASTALGGVGRRLFACVGGLRAANSGPRRFFLGAANGLLPCGPVFAVALTALASGSLLRGTAGMVGFGLGTAPLLFAFGLGANRWGWRHRGVLARFSTVLVVAMSVQLTLRGMAGFDWIAHGRMGEVILW